MTKLSLPPLDYFKKQAKLLLRKLEEGNTEALSRAKTVLLDTTNFSLMRAQHVVAVEHGFQKWEELRQASAIQMRIAITMAKEPLLNDLGVGISKLDRSPSRAEREAKFQENRKRLRESFERVEKTMQWLQATIDPIKTINTNRTSYGMKHITENDIDYITNGVFIAAAIICGFPYKTRQDSINVSFGMSEKSWSQVKKRKRNMNNNVTTVQHNDKSYTVILHANRMASINGPIFQMTLANPGSFEDGILKPLAHVPANTLGEAKQNAEAWLHANL